MTGTASAANNKPLAGKRVVITRAREQSGSLAKTLSALGANVVECPAISIAPLEDYAEMDAAIMRLDAYDWVIFTSVNGVGAFASRLRELRRDTQSLRSRKLGAIGPATAAALQKVGCRPSFVPDTYVAEAILEQIGELSGARVLLPRADIARKALAEGLRAKGAEVDEIAAYRTVPGEGSATLADLLSAGGVDAVTFTSSSTVRYTIESLASAGLDEGQAVDLLNRTRIVCIGPITANTAAEHGVSVTSVAEEYTSDGLVGALVELFRSKAGDQGSGAGG